MPNKNIEVEIKLSPEVREMIEGELLPALAEVARLAAELAQAKHRVATLIAEKGRELNAEALCAENDRLTAELADARAKVKYLLKYIDGERSRHLEIVVDLGEQVTKLTAEVAEARAALEVKP